MAWTVPYVLKSLPLIVVEDLPLEFISYTNFNHARVSEVIKGKGHHIPKAGPEKLL